MSRKRKPVVGQLLEQIETRYYHIVPIVGTTQIEIHCKHCRTVLKFDDADHEQSAGAAQLFLKHLKTRHAKLLNEQHDVTIDKL